MKTLSFFFVFAFSIFNVFGQTPPTVTPTSAFIDYGSNVTLTAAGCAGTVNWSTGQTGTSISVSPKQSARVTATCTVGMQTSGASNSVLIQVGLTTSPCNSNVSVTSSLSNIGYRYESSNYILGSAAIEASASIQFKAQSYVQLNPGFEAKSGSVFKAFMGECTELQTREVLTGRQLPWEILWGPDDFIWMTEKDGKISRVNPQTGAVQTLITISDVYSNGEGGLLGMVLHPDFTNNPYVYVSYNYSIDNTISGMRVKVVRFTYNSGSNTLGSPFILVQNILGNSTHDGSRLVITPELKLFVTTGDAQNFSAPQDSTNLNGKILRMNLDGTAPADNPYPGSIIWSIGHRNPQGLVYANGKLYCSSHGANIEDEINLIQKKRNYGWPNVEGPCDTPSEITFCGANNVVEPIFSSGNSATWAFCGLDYYNNDAYPRWKDHLLMVSLKNQTLYSLKLSTDGNTIDGSPVLYFVNQFGRLRDIAIAPNGKVYLCTSNGGNGDKIIEITPIVE
ncbi:PQQ-dependent sugar dehydrogenase [Runella sp.]|uniref:PQQ-dependent sugar dehydrogenase n=1 Tax=Runella sp. TaxID=1960881 RepID=UPI003D11B5E7